MDETMKKMKVIKLFSIILLSKFEFEYGKKLFHSF